MAAPSQSPPPPPAIRACLFDMDGLLIDSEDLYTLCTDTVLREYGRPDLPWNIKAKLQGRPGPVVSREADSVYVMNTGRDLRYADEEASQILHDWAQLPITRDEYMAKIQVLQRQHFPSCQPLAGVPALLTTLASQTQPPVHIALATSSHSLNFALKTAHLKPLFSVFAEENRVLGDDKRIPQGRGKPAPDIYLLALDTINARLKREAGLSDAELVKPEECLVFEDSVPGVESGRRAGMQVVWCPHPGLAKEYRGREDEVLAGLTGEYKGELSASGTPAATAAPGVIGDGWGRVFQTLENFPYRDYGIHVEGRSD